MKDYKKCNLGEVPANAMVTRGGPGHNETEIAAYTNLFLYAQQFYGTYTLDEFRLLFIYELHIYVYNCGSSFKYVVVFCFSFSMFTSPAPYFDLIFSDSTRQLRPLKGKLRSASQYLGHTFMRAHRLTDCSPSTSSAVRFSIPNVVYASLVILSLLKHFC